MPIVEKRYAEALAELAEQQGKLELMKDQLGDFVNLTNKDTTLKNFIKDPKYSIELKKLTLEKVLDGKADPDLVSFIKILLDKSRISLIYGIYEQFCHILNNKKNVLNMSIITPFPMDEIQLDKVKNKYKTLYGAHSVNAQITVNPSLIGGIQVKIGDSLFDSSLLGRLQSLKEYLQQYSTN